MAALLTLLSTMVAAKLQLIQQWWLPIVNGWCQPFAAHAMATTQQLHLVQLNLILNTVLSAKGICWTQSSQLKLVFGA